MTWRRKRHGTTAAYEASQARVLALMQDWRKPAEVVIHQFVVRSGEAGDGGYAVFETDDLDAVHAAVEVLSGFNFHIDPVIDIDVTLAAKGVAIEWRDAAI
jgi:hypothetical protein